MRYTIGNHIDIYLLLIFFALYNNSWFSDLLGEHYYVIMVSLYIVIFLTVTNKWHLFFAYYNLKKIKGRNLSMCCFVSVLIILYRLSEFYLFRVGIRPEMIDVVQRNGPISVIPPLEDMFFIAIVFPVIRGYTGQTGMFSTSRTQPRDFYGFVGAFLICFYWFLLPHQYASNFLNPAFPFWERIRDFPVDILFGLFCGVMVFVKTRSLILTTLCHYLFNGLVWLYVYLLDPISA